MKPQRFQPLHAIYQRLGCILSDGVMMLYTTDFEKTKASDTKKCIEEMLQLFEHQMAIEEDLLFPSVYDYEPFVTAILRDDHRERRKQILQLREILNAQGAAEDYLTILFAGRLIRKFTEFMALCVGQMRDHDTMITPVLWRYYSDSELRLISLSLQELSAAYQHTTTVAA